MGNYRFRLSDMIPNSWFYKLRDMSRTTTTTAAAAGKRSTTSRKKDHHSSMVPRAPPLHPQPPVKPGRASYYIPSCSEDKFPNFPANPKASDTKFLLDPPRKSKKKHREGRSVLKPSAKIVTSSMSSGCTCRTTLGSTWRPECPLVPERGDYDNDDDDDDDDDNNNDDDDSGNGNTNNDVDWLPCLDKTVVACNNCRVTSSATDIIIDIDEPKSREPGKTTGEFHLPPILTRPTKKEACPVPKLEQKSSRRRSSAGVQGKRMRANSPRLAGKKMQAHRSRKSSALAPTPRRGLSGSFAVVKSSSNPRRDFRDSMMEMIVENNIRAAKDLEELLACYLSLNSNEYHDVIVKVFEQIWIDLTNIKL